MFDTTEELLRQIRLGEDSDLELKDVRFSGRKVSAPSRNDMSDELAAFANSSGGVIVIGADDKTKTVVGIPPENLDMAETWLREICNDSIEPQLYCRIRKMSIPADNGAQCVFIRVDIPKSIFVHQSSGGYFYRVGSSKRKMTTDILARLIQQRSQSRLVRFDEQAVVRSEPAILEKHLWGKFESPLMSGDDVDNLLKLKLLAYDEDGALRPTVGGILLATSSPRDVLPNAFIQAVSYRGVERNAAYQLDAMDFSGPLDSQIFGAIGFVKKNMRIYATKTPARVDIPQYSIRAVFEAVVNAVAHRDYSIEMSKIRLHMFSNRLELFSPGSIPNTMTVDTIPFRQASRNELLVSLLARCPVPSEIPETHRTSLMERRGEGVPIILTESEKLSGYRPVYRLIDDAELMLTIFATTPNFTEGEVL